MVDDAFRENPTVAEIDRMKKDKLDLTDQMYDLLRQGRTSEANYVTTLVLAKQDDIESFPRESRVLYRELSEKRDGLERRNLNIISKDSLEAETILKAINNAPRLNPDNTSKAPFKHSALNTDESWQHAPHEQVMDYLSDKLFMDTYGLASSDTPAIQIRAEAGDYMEIPLDLIVNASGFGSWAGREGVGSGKDVSGKYKDAYEHKIKSIDVIKHYASLPSELPPVSEIRIYVQPDGTMFADNTSGDSHRIAAAILRGDKTIKAEWITIQTIDDYVAKPVEASNGDKNNLERPSDAHKQLGKLSLI